MSMHEIFFSWCASFCNAFHHSVDLQKMCNIISFDAFDCFYFDGCIIHTHTYIKSNEMRYYHALWDNISIIKLDNITHFLQISRMMEGCYYCLTFSEWLWPVALQKDAHQLLKNISSMIISNQSSCYWTQCLLCEVNAPNKSLRNICLQTKLIA